jgi:ribosomal protein S18 acetylase RimI-like enzyme
MCPLLAHCRLSLGTLYAKGNLREQARAELAAAIALYRSLRYEVDAILTKRYRKARERALEQTGLPETARHGRDLLLWLELYHSMSPPTPSMNALCGTGCVDG